MSFQDARFQTGLLTNKYEIWKSRLTRHLLFFFNIYFFLFLQYDVGFEV